MALQHISVCHTHHHSNTYTPTPWFPDHVGIRCDNVLISGHYAGQWVSRWSQWSIHGINWESHWSDSSFTSFPHKVAWNLMIERISSLRCIFISLSLHTFFSQLSQFHWCLQSFHAHLFVYFIFLFLWLRGFTRRFWQDPNGELTNAGVAWRMCVHTHLSE